MSENFSKGKRGAVLPSDPNKVRITIRLDGDIIEHFKEQVITAGGGNYQTLINEVLRKSILTKDESFEEAMRNIVREEINIMDEDMKNFIRNEVKLTG